MSEKLFRKRVRSIEDSMIIQLYWDRDESAISATSEKYGAYCRSIAMNILGDREDAEECVNDTYLGVWNSIPPHRPNVLPAFLGKITRNLSLNKYRQKHAEKRGCGQMGAVLDELAECVSDKSDIEQDIDRKELIKEINQFLGTLPQVKRGIFVGRYWRADSISEIAARYGMTENRVSVTLNRLRKQLNRYLSERGFEL